ncbi:MAG: cyclic nucleotide-binding domain-containing protein [Deltaproteobacteria bacterium]|nr:cyclic nucleotide-binding domain-containing protein [Deltaproteobacteria bacterium]
MLTTIEKMLFLNKVDMFKDVSLDNLLSIAGIAKETSYPGRTVIFKEGDEGDSLYLIVEGSVGVKKGGAKESGFIAVLRPPQCVGEMAIVSHEPRSATVETIEDTNFLVIDKKGFEAFIKKNPEIAFSIFNMLAARLRDITARLAEGMVKKG